MDLLQLSLLHISIAPSPDDTATTYFPETPLTSSYLIAFVVSDFEYTSNAGRPDVLPHRVYAKPSEVNNTLLALKDGERILSAISDYVNINYTYPKMDQIAIPDFDAGAMENWGLVTYREEYLLWDDKVHPYDRKSNIVKIIAHEFGHQYFGNLVTPQWWSFIWLNEGKKYCEINDLKGLK